MQYEGEIQLIIGPMYSGKTTELLRLYKRYYLAGKKCILIKHNDDNRYDPNYVVTHDQKKYKAISTKCLEDVINNKDVITSEVICIDEIQFFSDAAPVCDTWANEGKIVITAGLNGDCFRKPFTLTCEKTNKQLNPISELLAIVDMDKLTSLTAICKKTGNNASFTKRITEEKEVKVIGGSEKYIACSRKAYFSSDNIEGNSDINII